MKSQNIERPRRAQLSGRVPREFKNQVLNYSRWSGEPLGKLMQRVLAPVVTPQMRNVATATQEDKSDG